MRSRLLRFLLKSCCSFSREENHWRNHMAAPTHCILLTQIHTLSLLFYCTACSFSLFRALSLSLYCLFLFPYLFALSLYWWGGEKLIMFVFFSSHSIIKGCCHWKEQDRFSMAELRHKLQSGEKTGNDKTVLRASQPINIQHYLQEAGYGEAINYTIFWKSLQPIRTHLTSDLLFTSSVNPKWWYSPNPPPIGLSS